MFSRYLIALLFVPLAGTACSDEFSDTVAVVKSQDERNSGIDFALSRRSNSLVFDLTHVSHDKSSMDVFRVFLQTAASLKDTAFDEVVLTYKGNQRFRLGGQDFHIIGAEFGTQNPMYTLRTFPEKLKSTDGTSAFPTRSGGLLYLTRAQMEDFSAFIEQWYFADLKAAYQAELEKDMPEEYDDDEAL